MGGITNTSGINVTATATVSFTLTSFKDWAIYNGSWPASQRLSGGGATITNPIPIGGAVSRSFVGASPIISWSGGTPTDVGVSTAGIYADSSIPGSFSTTYGIQIKFAAGTATSEAILWFSLYDCGATITAFLSDGSAASFSVSTTAIGAGASTPYRYSFQYFANSDAQTLTVNVVSTNAAGATDGNVAFVAAAWSRAAAGSIVAPFTFNLLGCGAGG